jgi:hypothetical protein
MILLPSLEWNKIPLLDNAEETGFFAQPRKVPRMKPTRAAADLKVQTGRAS